MVNNGFYHIANELLMKYQHNQKAECLTGVRRNNLVNLNISVRKTKTKSHHKDIKKSEYFKDLKYNGNTYYYPLDVETRLITLTKIGQLGEILSILKAIYDKNIIEDYLCSGETKQFIYQMRGTLMRIGEFLINESNEDIEEFTNRIKGIEHCERIDEFFKSVGELYMYFCIKVNRNKKSHNTNLIKRITNYISMNYMNDEINLLNIASKFGVTEKYLSRFFKEQTGEYFSEYVERKRMAKAIELLAEGNLTVTDIRKSIGYSNNNTFYKAFKRFYGVSPSTFRREAIV